MKEQKLRYPIQLLAPAGNWESLKAGVANGADAIYFGVEKFNARARADNFRTEELPEIMAYLHLHGVKGYLTFNILVFEDELREARELIEACMDAGVDAVIVQDLGLVKLIRQLSPDFPIHASTQMTITSPEGLAFLEEYNLQVAVLGRENNLKQIETIARGAKVPLEVFVHGALCVSYSGQCLTSEMLGGRSANRGECAQACRLPYELICDGKKKEMGNVAYLLSPKDLAAIDLIPELIEAGVSVFKIEGRMKSPEYVANVVGKYRKAIDMALMNQSYKLTETELRELQQSFSRGFTHGFLKGTNNKQLLDGTYPKSRGVYLGKVLHVGKDHVVCNLEAPLKRGDGIVFDAGSPEEKEEGGRVYDLRRKGKKIEGEAVGRVEIVPGRYDVNLRKVHVGDKIWKTSDPDLDRRLRKTFEQEQPYRLFPLSISARGKVGEPLVSRWVDVEKGNEVEIKSEIVLEKALKRPLSSEYLREQWGRLGGTIYRLNQLTFESDNGVIIPVKELNRMRREAVEQLIRLRQMPPRYTRNPVQLLETTLIEKEEERKSPQLRALCRTLEQVGAAVGTNIEEIYADFEFMKDYPRAVALAHAHGKKISLATPRIHMPGENGFFKSILKADPDGILIRNIAGVYYYQKEKVSLPLYGDFSLNVANHLAVELFLERGLQRITPSYDLNVQQMVDLISNSTASQLELVIHQHLPMFHTEHCIYCTFLSEGKDYTNCGQPCEKHRASLRDRVGMAHPVRVDAGCRNTIYNAVEQSGAEYVDVFLAQGINQFRVEFLEEGPEKVEEVITLYQEALEGKRSGTSVWKSLKAINQLGVTRGQLIR